MSGNTVPIALGKPLRPKGGQNVRSRRLTAEWLERTAALRRGLGAVLVALGVALWAVAVIAPLPQPKRWMGVIFAGALVSAGIIVSAV